MSETLRLVLTGGGTGGHVYPALAVTEAARIDPTSPPVEFRYVGSPDGMERGLVEPTGIPYEVVAAGAIRGRSPLTALRGFLRMAQGVSQARALFARYHPHAVLATGGFVGVPVVVAARLAGIPAVIYLPDLRPGWAVRFLARIATAVAVSFEEVVPHVAARRVVVTGYPVRPGLSGWSRPVARAALGLPTDDPVLLVLGGSRGSQSINEAILADLPSLLGRAAMIHASGAAHFAVLDRRRRALPDQLGARYHLFPYLDRELAPAMAAATLVVARSGASVLGELPAVGAPGVLVPYPYAGAHQTMNANFLKERNAAIVVDDALARQGTLSAAILDLLDDPGRLQELSANARALAQPDAANRLFALLCDAAERRAAPRVREETS